MLRFSCLIAFGCIVHQCFQYHFHKFTRNSIGYYSGPEKTRTRNAAHSVEEIGKGIQHPTWKSTLPLFDVNMAKSIATVSIPPFPPDFRIDSTTSAPCNTVHEYIRHFLQWSESNVEEFQTSIQVEAFLHRHIGVRNYCELSDVSTYVRRSLMTHTNLRPIHAFPASALQIA